MKFGHIKNNPKYKGEYKLYDLDLNLGKDKSIFVCSAIDLFASSVPSDFIHKILSVCNNYPQNVYLFQTKNPMRFFYFQSYFPPNSILATTIESDINYFDISRAPPQTIRFNYVKLLHTIENIKIMISIEPIMDFSSNFAKRIIECSPDIVSIGANSKNCNLPEPSYEKINNLIFELKKHNINIKLKKNLFRIYKNELYKKR